MTLRPTDLRQAFPFDAPAVQHALRACWDYQRTLPLSDGGVPDRPATTTDLWRLYEHSTSWIYWLPPDPVPQRPPPELPPGRGFEELDAAFLHAILCQVGLPRQKVEGREWTRRSGAAWLHVQAGVLAMGRAGPVEQPIPYGALPRLALAWISSYAVRHRTRDVPLGESAREFLRWIGIPDEQGARYRTLRQQLHALAACRLTLGQGAATYSGQPIEGLEVWLPGDGQQRALWPAHLTLSRSYYETLIARAVPLDPAALIALKGSALALDVYVWLAHRLHRVTEPVAVPWPRLKDQFGQEYQYLKDFKKEFRLRVRQVLAVYPAARVRWWADQDDDLVSSGGLLLEPSPPPVRPTTVAVGAGFPQKAGGRGGYPR